MMELKSVDVLVKVLTRFPEARKRQKKESKALVLCF